MAIPHYNPYRKPIVVAAIIAIIMGVFVGCEKEPVKASTSAAEIREVLARLDFPGDMDKAARFLKEYYRSPIVNIREHKPQALIEFGQFFLRPFDLPGKYKEMLTGKPSPEEILSLTAGSTCSINTALGSINVLLKNPEATYKLGVCPSKLYE